MLIFLATLFSGLSSMFRSRVVLELENSALRHQIDVLQRSREQTSQVDATGPSDMGRAVPNLERLAFGLGHRPAGNGRGLTSCLPSPVHRPVNMSLFCLGKSGHLAEGQDSVRREDFARFKRPCSRFFLFPVTTHPFSI